MPLDLNNNFTQRYYALLLGSAQFRSNFSLSYLDRQKVFRLGGGEDIDVAPSKELKTCEVPTTGYIYGAIATGLEGPERSGAEKAIDECIAAVTAYEAAEEGSSERNLANADLEDSIQWMNMMRGFYDIFQNVVF